MAAASDLGGGGGSAASSAVVFLLLASMVKFEDAAVGVSSNRKVTTEYRVTQHLVRNLPLTLM